MRITVLGSGTSSGVPTIACQCRTCSSDDPRDKRLRTSIWIEDDTTSVIIDSSADFRQQCLRAGVRHLDGVVYTHHHFDHISGFDDLRAFNFVQRRPVPIFALAETLEHMRRVFGYAFEAPSGPRENSAPAVISREIEDDPFTIGTLEFMPLPLQHGRMRVNGYRIGRFAYCTDCNEISPLARERLEGVEVLILDALRYSPHPTHFTLEEATATALDLGVPTVYFTHVAHDMLHDEASAQLPSGFDLAWDGLVIEST